MVRHEGDIGSKRYPAFKLDHYSLEHYSVRINGVERAGGSVKNDLITLYHDSMRAHNGDHFIPFKNYSTGSFIIVVDCNNQSDENTVQIDVRGNLDISLRFRVALPHNVKLFVMGTVDSTFTIDNNRLVTINYQVYFLKSVKRFSSYDGISLDILETSDCAS